MQHLEFKVVNTKLMNMGGGDPQKAMEERTAYLNKIREDAEAKEKAGQYQYNSSSNPFPDWLRNLIREMAVESHSKARYDDENIVFRFNVNGDRCDFDDFFDKFKQRFEVVKKTSADGEKWALADGTPKTEENILCLTSSPDDEVAAMNDLEAHQRNTALPVSRKTKSEAD